MVNIILSGGKVVMELYQIDRLKICEACEYKVSTDCALCGCDIQKKTAIAEESCPAKPKKWDALFVMSEAEKAGQVPGCSSCNKRR